MQGLQAACGTEVDDLWQAAAALGGGIARMQDVCGALTGAAMATGAILARQQGWQRGERNKLRQASTTLVADLYRSFQTELGAADCRTITGHDFNAPAGYEGFRADAEALERCRKCIRLAVGALADMGTKV